MESSHLNALQSKHAVLERLIAQEMARPSPDGILVKDLKRRKLRIKEELSIPPGRYRTKRMQAPRKRGAFSFWAWLE
jgi:hypothetical protein